MLSHLEERNFLLVDHQEGWRRAKSNEESETWRPGCTDGIGEPEESDKETSALSRSGAMDREWIRVPARLNVVRN